MMMMMMGNYGLPVPQHSAKLGGSSLFLHHSRAGSVESSGRNSPVLGWGENGQVTTHIFHVVYTGRGLKFDMYAKFTKKDNL